jgi:hypothetical protein
MQDEKEMLTAMLLSLPLSRRQLGFLPVFASLFATSFFFPFSLRFQFSGKASSRASRFYRASTSSPVLPSFDCFLNSLSSLPYEPLDDCDLLCDPASQPFTAVISVSHSSS